MVSKFQACTMSRSSVVIVHKVIGVFFSTLYLWVKPKTNTLNAISKTPNEGYPTRWLFSLYLLFVGEAHHSSSKCEKRSCHRGHLQDKKGHPI